MARASKMNRSGVGSKKTERPVWAGHYATKTEMVKEIHDDVVIAEDGDGCYLTTTKWVDKKFTDPNRMNLKRHTFEELSFRLKKQEEDAKKRYLENKLAEHEFEEAIEQGSLIPRT